MGPGPHAAFNAALYTLDVLIPAPAFGQASDWNPQGAGLLVAAGLHILGWLLAITVIAAITRSSPGPRTIELGPAGARSHLLTQTQQVNDLRQHAAALGFYAPTDGIAGYFGFRHVHSHRGRR